MKLHCNLISNNFCNVDCGGGFQPRSSSLIEKRNSEKENIEYRIMNSVNLIKD